MHNIGYIKVKSSLIRGQYLAFVMLFLAATSLAVRGSGSEVGIGDFWGKVKEKSVTECSVIKNWTNCLQMSVAYEEIWHGTIFSS